MARETVTKLVRVGSIVEDLLHDGSHEESIVTASPYNVRSLGKLIKFLLNHEILLIGNLLGLRFLISHDRYLLFFLFLFVGGATLSKLFI